MKNMITLITVAAIAGMPTQSHAASEASSKAKVDYKDDGGYEAKRSSETTDAVGTNVSKDSQVDVDVDSRGMIKKTVKSETTTDPKGIMNQKEDDGKSVFEEKANGGYKQTTTRKHTDRNGTNVTYKTVTDVDVDDLGNVTTTAKTEKTLDPKGLFNSKTTTSTTKSVNGQVVEQKKKMD